ncbi:MAG: peptidoglycan DD-metalloendopeptidase family protein [Acidobacteriota bacterium]|nr:peptidoglycan DD-metalloendopeptidase family protein [Acidobacteriota bacterium]
MRSTVVAVIALASVSLPGSLAEDVDPDRLRRTQEEIRRLRADLEELTRLERGVLGKLEKLGADLRLRSAEVREVSLRLERIGEEVERYNRELAGIEEAQQQRRGYLAFRLREMYKRGPEAGLRRVVGGVALSDYLRGLRYAAYLSERDARVLGEFRGDRVAMTEAREGLEAEQARLNRTQDEARRAEQALGRSRRSHEAMLEEIRTDADKRRAALAELESAAAALAAIAARPGTEGASPTLDVTKFQGLLDRPAEGAISTGFGNVVHPRFKTVVPHPGLDIEAEQGARFNSVFDGTVVFASWLNGYGLTVLVDHGGGLISVYAHASVIVVEENEAVTRGQMLGQVGDTGSLRGPYLYFEMRLDGTPVDPATWLRPGEPR